MRWSKARQTPNKTAPTRKTVLARTLASSLGMEFVFFNCSAVIEATDFLATVQVRASEAGQPVMDFIKTDLLIALEAAGQHSHRRYLMFLDELNRCQESARNALMPALDSTRRIFNPVENSFLSIPDNVQFVAAVNRGSEFSGTFGIDAAQLDRFPLFAESRRHMLREILKSSFCGRFSGHWEDVTSDAGAVWAMIKRRLGEDGAKKK